MFGFQNVIEDYKELNKDTLTALLDIHLRTIGTIIPAPDYFECSDIDDLREYLKNSSPKQVLTIKERDCIIDKAKKILFFCNIAGFCVGSTTYSTIEEVVEDAYSIKKYGDIPTIRRAIRLLNTDMRISPKIEIVMTYRSQQRLERSKRIKKNGLARMKLVVKPPGEQFILSFD